MVQFDNCVDHALDAYLRRASKDTNPTIVLLLHPDGKDDAHWYYRSDQVVSTSAFEWPDRLGEYEGPIDELSERVRKHFQEGRYRKYDFLTNLARKRVEHGCKGYTEAFPDLS